MGVKHLFGGGGKFSSLLTPFWNIGLLISVNPVSLLLSLRVLNELKFWGRWAPVHSLFFCFCLGGGGGNLVPRQD